VYPSGSDGERLNGRGKLIRLWGKLMKIGTQYLLNTSPKLYLHTETPPEQHEPIDSTIHNSYNGSSKHLTNLFITELAGAPLLSDFT
jgi:hypothetical protein